MISGSILQLKGQSNRIAATTGRGEAEVPANCPTRRDRAVVLRTAGRGHAARGLKSGDQVGGGATSNILNGIADGHILAGINRAIAYTYGKEGNHPEALKYLDLALAGNPNDTVLLQLAAASATQLNDFPRAMAYLARIDETTLDNPSVLADAAVNLINKRRAADGIALLDRVIARFPDAPDAYFYRGFAKAQASQNDAAKADLEKFLTLAPADNPQVAKAREILAALK